MEKIIKYGKIIRTNWKKSILGAIAIYYGGLTVKEKYEINLLMRAACKEASKYGDDPIAMECNPKLVTVILNPVANKRRAKQDFEKYCEPLLHLAGLQVDVIHTASEGNAKELVENMKNTEAIIVAGGDGTLSESVTGLLRRNDDANRFPLGILPLGRTNTIGSCLFPGGDGKDVERVKQLIEASMAIIRGKTLWKDAMKIEPVETNEEESPGKPIYAMSSLEWGAFRDIVAKKYKYWMYGSLKEYAAFVFNGFKDSLNWNCKGLMTYSPPCAGCSNCVKKPPEMKRKWAFFIQPPSAQPDLQHPANNINPECETTEELCFQTCDFRILTPNIHQLPTPTPALIIGIGKFKYSYLDFVGDGWDRVTDKSIPEPIYARSVTLYPEEHHSTTLMDIDKEEYEAKAIKITILPKVVRLFCKSEQLN